MSDYDLFKEFEELLTPPKKAEKEEKTIMQKDGKLFIRLQDGRLWSPSRQHRGSSSNFTEKDVERLNEIMNPSDSFIAVDFETATYSRMICQVGIVKVVERKIVDRVVKLVQPPLNYYDQKTISVHGITPEMTATAPSFDSIWKSIKKYFIKSKIVAHNAAFDEDVLRRNLEFYRINDKDIKDIREFVCTCKLFDRMSLHDLCEGFGMDTSGHHDALFDAECCANFYLRFLNGEKPSISLDKKKTYKDLSCSDPFHCITDEILSTLTPLPFFQDKKFIITGGTVFDRDKAYKIIKTLGGKKLSSIGPTLNYAVIGQSPGPKKIEELEKLTSEGCIIQRISDNDFVEIVKLNLKSIFNE